MPRRVLPRRPVRRRGLAGHPRHPAGRAGRRRGAGGVPPIGYGVDDPAAEANRLGALGYPGYATAGTTPLLNRGPAGTLIELCDLHSDRPSLRDLFPPGSEFAGEPLAGSAL